MSSAVQPLLLILLCRDLFDYALVTTGSVLDAAIDAADGRRADLDRLHDLVVGAAAEEQFCCLEPLGHIGDFFHGTEVFKKIIALFARFEAEDRVEQCIGRLVSSGISFRHSCLLI